MPDFTFYIDDADRDSILESLLKGTGLAITPNINYPDPVPKSFASLTPELIRGLDTNPRCYISGAFSTCNIQTIKMEKGICAGTYVVAENKGGPLLVLSLGTQKTKDLSPCLVPSHLTYASKFWNTQLTQLVSPTADLKAAFRDVRKLLMSHCKSLKQPCRAWVGHSALKSFKAEKTSMLVNGMRLKVTGEIR